MGREVMGLSGGGMGWGSGSGLVGRGFAWVGGSW